MEQKTHQRLTSKKLIKNLDDLYGEKKYYFPPSLSNDRNPDTGVASIFVQAGIHKWYVPCGEPTSLEHITFCVLRDGGVQPEKYELNGEADPLYESR